MNRRRDDSYLNNGESLKCLIRERAFKERTEADEPWTLKSGRKSRVYFDLRPVLLQSQGLDMASLSVANMIDDLQEDNLEFDVDALAGVLDGGASLAAALGIHYWGTVGYNMSILLVRKEVKDHGQGGLIMGHENVLPGSKVVVVEDVATTGGSAIRAVVALREAGYTVEHCIAVLDREEGAREALLKEGVDLHQLYSKSQFSDQD